MTALKQLIGRLVGTSNVLSEENGEKPSSFYDDMYSDSEEYRKHYTRSRYYFMWTVIADRLLRSARTNILEVGCGSGQLANLLVDQGMTQYVGFDFSQTAIELAREKRLAGTEFNVDDALTTQLFEKRRPNAIVCTEVLEHVNDDLVIVDRFPCGCYALCTVPNFPYRSHVRYFETADDVESRYGAYFDAFNVTTFRRPDSEGGRYYLFEGTRNNHRLRAE